MVFSHTEREFRAVGSHDEVRRTRKSAVIEGVPISRDAFPQAHTEKLAADKKPSSTVSDALRGIGKVASSIGDGVFRTRFGVFGVFEFIGTAITTISLFAAGAWLGVYVGGLATGAGASSVVITLGAATAPISIWVLVGALVCGTAGGYIGYYMSAKR